MIQQKENSIVFLVKITLNYNQKLSKLLENAICFEISYFSDMYFHFAWTLL